MSINKGPIRVALHYIQEARKMMEMNTMRLSPPTGEISGPRVDEWNQQVRETSRIWRQTWVVSPLDEAIELLEKELAK